MDRRENVADVDYQDPRNMKAHVGSRPGSEGGLFYAVVVKQSLGATKDLVEPRKLVNTGLAGDPALRSRLFIFDSS